MKLKRSARFGLLLGIINTLCLLLASILIPQLSGIDIEGMILIFYTFAKISAIISLAFAIIFGLIKLSLRNGFWSFGFIFVGGFLGASFGMTTVYFLIFIIEILTPPQPDNPLATISSAFYAFPFLLIVWLLGFFWGVIEFARR